MSRGKGSDGLPPDRLTVARHPRARSQVRRLRAGSALAAAALVLLLSLRAGVPVQDAWLRGLVGGVVTYMVAWAVAVTVWRHLAMAEVEAARRRVVTARKEAAAAAQAEARS